MPIFSVVSHSIKDNKRRVVIKDNKNCRVHLTLHRFALVGGEDKVFIDPNNTKRIYVLNKEDPKDKIKITPHFRKVDELSLGKLKLKFNVSEIIDDEEIRLYNELELFHYRSGIFSDNGEDKKSQNITGRKSVLLCFIKEGRRKIPVGYIELAQPLMMCKPRHDLFANPFSHPDRPIKWIKWDQNAIRDYVNLIVRISRVVISPEFRGLGIAKILIQHAKNYAIERWHVAGRRPLFIEISAEMLKYIDFVSSSGLNLIGYTEGNLARVHKDMRYMSRGYEASSGIMTLQRKYLKHLRSKADSLDCSLEHLLKRLCDIADNPEKLGTLPLKDWYIFKSILRMPIPYYLAGLDEHSDEYIKKHSARFNKLKTFGTKSRNSYKHLKFSNINIEVNYEVPRTRNTQAIMDCFGINGEIIKSAIVSNLSIEASMGNIFFIAGQSGSGKSVLLKSLDPEYRDNRIKISAKLESGKYSAAWLEEITSDLPLIEYLSQKWGIENSISALNQAGLAEAFVYLKPYFLLSKGQRYRAKLAELLLKNESIWLIDEFGADLDPLSARIVAKNLRRIITKSQCIAFVAAANHHHFLDALRPTRIITLNHGARPEILTYKEYDDEYNKEVI